MKYAFILSVILVQSYRLYFVNLQTCFDLENDRRFYFDQFTPGSSLAIFKDIGLIACLKECLLRSRCTAIDFEPKPLRGNFDLCTVLDSDPTGQQMAWTRSITSMATDWKNVSFLRSKI